MKPGKVLCYRFLFAILGVDRAQNLTKYNRWLRVFMKLQWNPFNTATNGPWKFGRNRLVYLGY